jgi:hypothetical protein
MFKLEDYQTYSKEGYEAMLGSAAAVTKGYQAMTQEVVDFSRKSFEKSSEVAGKAMAAKSFDKVLEVQQGFARESYDALVGEMTRLNDLFVAATKDAYKPFETGMSVWGVKFPK